MTAAEICQRNAKIILTDYPDVLNLNEMCEILGISAKTGYKLLKSGKIKSLKVGRAYRIPKIYLISYLGILNCDD